MRAHLRALVWTGFLLVALPTLSYGFELEEAFFIRGGVGMVSRDLGSFEGSLMSEQTQFEADGFSTNYEAFEDVPSGDFELGIRFSPTLSLSASYCLEENTLSNTFSDATVSGSDELELVVWNVSTNVAYWIPAVPGLYFGGSIGAGRATVNEKYSLTDTGAGADEPLTESGAYQADGFVFGAFAGLQIEWPSIFLIYAQGGFQHRNFGTLEGRFSDQVIKPGVDWRNLHKQPMGDFNLNGYYVRVGMGVAFEL